VYVPPQAGTTIPVVVVDQVFESDVVVDLLCDVLNEKWKVVLTLATSKSREVSTSTPVEKVVVLETVTESPQVSEYVNESRAVTFVRLVEFLDCTITIL